jgi:hypothetical protein
MTTMPSDAAPALLQRRFAGARVSVNEETRPLYRKLAAAGLMMPLHTFALGPNSAYRLTDAGCDLRDQLNGHASHAPSAGAARAPHG